jgi:hypothetical protein
MKIQLIALSLCVLASTNLVKGQGFTPSENKHEIRLSVSDGLTQGSVDILGMGLADAVTGSKRTDENYSLVYGFGYRYSLGRFKVGTDLGFSSSNSKLALAGEQPPSLKESNVNFMILPAAEFVYYKRGLFELYGTAAAGVNLKFTLLSFNEGGCSPANASLLLEEEKPKSVPTLKRPNE